MLFIGTSAGEAIPNPFCRCRVCENARKVGGREIRTRSSFMLDNKNVIDLGADYLTQAFLRGITLDGVENVIFTHMHSDHICYNFLWERHVRGEGGDHPLHVWLSEEGYHFFTDVYLKQKWIGGDGAYCKDVTFHPLKFGETVQIGDYTATPLRGNHRTEFDKNSTNYLLEKGDMRLYYALDSGYFLEETFAALAGKKLTTLVMECTNPYTDKPRASEKSPHNDLFLCLRTLDRLYESEAITADTAIYLSHISPFGVTHAELCDYVTGLDKPYRIHVAYDGLEI
ncbi:MAG: hypothetical protein IJ493_04180 [Clostridia bacterium]|nr:hypothetical protein [Clostridia bacterium]